MDLTITAQKHPLRIRFASLISLLCFFPSSLYSTSIFYFLHQLKSNLSTKTSSLNFAFHHIRDRTPVNFYRPLYLLSDNILIGANFSRVSDSGF
ncbi:unnamed protein product [Coffea canephora]|uniref:Uncharacterized protein n=1 Tax=Coffea canephora TaxID=49390 RepID=A0A068UST8_COFCA|nr:unnamed protein product [Coffea canephora]